LHNRRVQRRVAAFGHPIDLAAERKIHLVDVNLSDAQRFSSFFNINTKSISGTPEIALLSID
jgi:hypothetical protein